ncbi:alpha/beta fold hydrolase [Aeromicrobium ginsengisoli]|uniref:Alpha/beta hydrolase n=1 Tax=Aeromicrobium ginsengisoli TaxID=363867 RepID=A0A5M4FI22_9ACTN|nr:alpha/beta hydrolase [Aeromicrobium ginsengisoli]KAA1399383.1 alpha/beta hydrolase [Aeromicrobium ginsengisoli]
MAQPTYVLVPGAGGVAAYWALVRRELDGRGLPSIAVDLPGDDPVKGLPAYVDLIVEAAAGIDDVVLVAQSIGGFSGSWAADRLPTSRIVLLNAMIPLPGETAGEWWDATGSGEARRDHDIREGRDPDANFDLETYFLHDVPADALAALGDGEHGESDAIFAAPWGLDAWPDIPTTVLAGRSDRFFPYAFQQRVARERLGIEVTEVPGGHLAALSQPVEVTQAIVSAP